MRNQAKSRILTMLDESRNELKNSGRRWTRRQEKVVRFRNALMRSPLTWGLGALGAGVIFAFIARRPVKKLENKSSNLHTAGSVLSFLSKGAVKHLLLGGARPLLRGMITNWPRFFSR